MVNQRLKQQFGNYRLLRLLGQGGFSEVYLGEHVYLKTQAAIKILKVRLERREFQHFLREARIIAHLEHPHIIQVLDFGLEKDIPFLVLTYAPNGSLRQRYPKGTALPLAKDPLQRFASVEDFATALEEASKAVPGSTNDTIEIHAETKEETFHSAQQEAFSEPATLTIWHVPYARNPHFTGRADILERISTLLQSNRDSAQLPLAITGMGGIGKTQTLIEYAYRNVGKYAAVLWAKADAYESLFADFVAIARELQLVDNSEQGEQDILNAMKR